MKLNQPLTRHLHQTHRRLLLTGMVALMALSHLSCAPSTPQPPSYPSLLAGAIQKRVIGEAPLANQKLQAAKTLALENQAGPVTTAPRATGSMLSTVVRLKKAALLNRKFLYGANLQYSSIGDPEDLLLQSMAAGHVTAFFKLFDDRLQFLADQSSKFESTSNQPSRLIHEFPVINQDADTVTISIRQASPIVITIVEDDKAASPRTSWVRSVEFVNDKQLLLIETSIETQKGEVAEFMESIVPRDTMIPSDAKPLFAETDLNPNAERFRFLSSDPVWIDIAGKGRVKTTLAQRFAWSPNPTDQKAASEPIAWYITPNVPDEFLPSIQLAVEAWNRYSQALWKRDIVSFKGRLPEGIKLGDPRFNVINWDSVSVAGAAYESQATDPETGIQTHSLIYLPKAWVEMGRKYWQDGSYSEKLERNTEKLAHALERGRLMGRKLPVNCMRNALQSLSLKSRHKPDEFAKELLKGVLFHEMGHALGLGHNFKGSLSMDHGDAKSAFSNSIMDYNQYHLERAAFDSLDSANGPLLEYDRQMLSALYNDGKELSDKDPVLPVCGDEEARSLSNGADPLCIAYDRGTDPTRELEDAVRLVRDDTAFAREQISLAQAIRKMAPTPQDASFVKTKADAKLYAEVRHQNLEGLISFYYTAGAQSIQAMARANIVSLRRWKFGVLPASYDESGMRQRTIDAVRYATTAESFETPTVQALKVYREAVRSALTQAPFAMGSQSPAVSAEIDALMAYYDRKVETSSVVILTKMRARVLSDLKNHEESPFYLKSGFFSSTDFESEVTRILFQAVTSTLEDGSLRPLVERQLAAKSLRSFETSAIGAARVKEAIRVLRAQAMAADTQAKRLSATNTLQVLTAPDKSTK